MVLPETDAAGAAAVAERFRCGVASASLLVDGRRIAVTASLGVATYPAPGVDSIERLLKAADQALYHAKGSGRNRVCA